MRNKHLSSEERDKITILQGEGLSIRKIAKELDRSPSTISRELNRKEAPFFRGKHIGSQTNIASIQMPNFGALKPLTEEQKCRKLLNTAVTEQGKMRFVTRDEDNNIVKAIQKFKTDGSKSELLKTLLYDKTNNVPSKLNAYNIVHYFYVMSGKTSNMQRYIANDISSIDSKSAKQRLDLICIDGKNSCDNTMLVVDRVIKKHTEEDEWREPICRISDSELEYIDKHLTGSDDDKAIKTSFLLDVISKCQYLSLGTLVRTINIPVRENFETIILLAGLYNKTTDNSEQISHALSLINQDNVPVMHNIANSLISRSPLLATKLMKEFTENNLDFVNSAIRYADSQALLDDLKYINSHDVELPARNYDDYTQTNRDYCDMVRNIIDSKKDEENELASIR